MRQSLTAALYAFPIPWPPVAARGMPFASTPPAILPFALIMLCVINLSPSIASGHPSESESLSYSLFSPSALVSSSKGN
ncbi:hypothetical protein [Chryseobacterium schmidteae]|uniref:hypothetical protein n=1 Tax=Chryseobacterium schmidteae TaxID=2730404 RepID=UPI001E4E4381|nr:hypothetical protein [Chryseobacterium schmidteae]